MVVDHLDHRLALQAGNIFFAETFIGKKSRRSSPMMSVEIMTAMINARTKTTLNAQAQLL